MTRNLDSALGQKVGWGKEGGGNGRFGRRHIRLVVRPLSCRLSFISIYNVIMYKRNV